jgi:hypothetical protein
LKECLLLKKIFLKRLEKQKEDLEEKAIAAATFS